MNKLTQALKSRTNWTILVGYLIAYGPVISSWVPSQWKPFIEGVLGLLAFYFHTNPSQVYTPADVTPPLPGQSIVQIQP